MVGCHVRVVGKEYMDTPGAKIYAANHTSYFDVLPLMLGLGVPYHFVAKLEVRHMPFIGTFLKQMGHVWFDRTKMAMHACGSRSRSCNCCSKANPFLFFRKAHSRKKTAFVRFNSARSKRPSARTFRSFRFRSPARENFCATEPIFRARSDVTITLSPPIYPRGACHASRQCTHRKRIRRLARPDSPSRRNAPRHRAARRRTAALKKFTEEHAFTGVAPRRRLPTHRVML